LRIKRNNSGANPTDGNRWILKVQPTPAVADQSNPTDGSRWILKVRPTPAVADQSNPTDGSRWILKVRPFGGGRGWTLTIHRLPSVGFSAIRCCIYFSKTINPRLRRGLDPRRASSSVFAANAAKKRIHNLIRKAKKKERRRNRSTHGKAKESIHNL